MSILTVSMPVLIVTGGYLECNICDNIIPIDPYKTLVPTKSYLPISLPLFPFLSRYPGRGQRLYAFLPQYVPLELRLLLSPPRLRGLRLLLARRA